ncbi:MAG: hypothetical protein JWL81_180 [Verrucomicrobiales bacterium]|nr:hypothetical protein [Verrucomicrobiales bacterium]
MVVREEWSAKSSPLSPLSGFSCMVFQLSGFAFSKNSDIGKNQCSEKTNALQKCRCSEKANALKTAQRTERTTLSGLLWRLVAEGVEHGVHAVGGLERGEGAVFQRSVDVFQAVAGNR